MYFFQFTGAAIGSLLDPLVWGGILISYWVAKIFSKNDKQFLLFVSLMIIISNISIYYNNVEWYSKVGYSGRELFWMSFLPKMMIMFVINSYCYYRKRIFLFLSRIGNLK